MPTISTSALWERYRQYLYSNPDLGFMLDPSRMNFTDEYLGSMAPRIEQALDAMVKLEAGAIANPDEHRMVGHYWLRAPELAPDPAIRDEIVQTVARIKKFAADVHSGAIKPEKADRFRHVLVAGIGGSALGPEFVSAALHYPDDKMKAHFFDNTDPDGMARTLHDIGDAINQTLTVIISKSGGTKETRNGQLLAKAAYERAGLKFAPHMVAVTGAGSDLDRTAQGEGWLERFPMWDWVGGRTSEMSAVGLVPGALQGIDIQEILDGAKAMDAVTRNREWRQNPAAWMALMWYWATEGKGKKDMVVLPYKDRLELFSRYLQQLVMESLGKELDLDGKVVHQGIAVYGNKGSTDQHAYVQQLRDGVLNFFVTFVEVLRDDTDHHGQGSSKAEAGFEVEPDVTSGDYLSGFLQGTREALYEKGRESITLTFDQLDATTIGKLIALYDRTVGLYGSLVNVNAYHQPGVEAGKKAAGEVIEVQRAVLETLRGRGQEMSVDELAQAIGQEDRAETVFHVCRHLAANGRLQSGKDMRYRI
jgi:glucose-6-phosphate isomerase